MRQLHELRNLGLTLYNMVRTTTSNLWKDKNSWTPGNTDTYPYAQYLPTFAFFKSPSFVGKYTSTMEHMGDISESPDRFPMVFLLFSYISLSYGIYRASGATRFVFFWGRAKADKRGCDVSEVYQAHRAKHYSGGMCGFEIGLLTGNNG